MTRSFRAARTTLAAALALAAAPAFAQATFSQTVFFGDSLTDAGFFRPLLPPATQSVTGQFTTNPGYVWSQYLADYYGTGAAPGWTASGTGPRAATGTNFAVGGARVGTTYNGSLGPTPSLAAQIAFYLNANGGQADPNALYTVWGGANDLFTVTNPAQAQPVIGAAVTAQVGLVGQLTSAGAQYILVPTIPDLGITPASRAGGATAMAQGTALATAYNTALFNGLAAQNLRVIPMDTFHLLQEIAASPADYGFRNVTGTGCNLAVIPGGSSLGCAPPYYMAPDAPFAYAFADGVHPSTGAHRILADYASSVIEAPRQAAVLGLSEAMVGRARTQMVSAWLDQPVGDEGTRWWADVRHDGQRVGPGSSADLYDGGGPTLTVGFDWAQANTVFGFFGAYGRQWYDWGLRRGDFTQSDATLGGYAGWTDGNFYVNGQLSYTRIDFDTERAVPLGPATRVHNGSTKGDNITVAANLGYRMGDGAFRHGPVLSVVAQQIDIDGFAESDPTLSTSMLYPDQSADSLIGSLGWELRYEVNDHLAPFAKITYDHEFEEPAAQVWGALQTLPGNPYAVPGLTVDRNYGTLVYGTRAELFGLDVVSGSAVTVGHKGGDHSSLFLTVSGAF